MGCGAMGREYRVKGERAVVGATQLSMMKVKLNPGADAGSGSGSGGMIERPLNAATVRLRAVVVKGGWYCQQNQSR
jgi:hypothetical protein